MGHGPWAETGEGASQSEKRGEGGRAKGAAAAQHAARFVQRNPKLSLCRSLGPFGGGGLVFATQKPRASQLFPRL